MELAVHLCDPGLTPAAAATQREVAGHVEEAIERIGNEAVQAVIEGMAEEEFRKVRV